MEIYSHAGTKIIPYQPSIFFGVSADGAFDVSDAAISSSVADDSGEFGVGADAGSFDVAAAAGAYVVSADDVIAAYSESHASFIL